MFQSAGGPAEIELPIQGAIDIVHIDRLEAHEILHHPLGADAAQIGTAFLATDESNATAMHKQMLFSDAARYTTLSRAFTGRLGRGITSRIAKDLINKEKGILPFPLQTQFMSHLRKEALEQEKWDMILFWGGQIAPILKHTKAAELMRSILEETTAYFDDLK